MICSICSAANQDWLRLKDDEITWLDRTLLSGGRDRTLHRAPRCAGLRHVHHRWELFSRDISHPVYLAPLSSEGPVDYQAVQEQATHVLPKANAALEAQPVRFKAGIWAVSVGKWALQVRLEVTSQTLASPTVPGQEFQTSTEQLDAPPGSKTRTRPTADAAERVAQFFRHNPTAWVAMAYYYQDFITGEVAPAAVPIADVAIALDLTGEATVSEYKKELQRRIWNEQGHQRELGEFLLANNLVGQAELNRACQIAALNQASGRVEQAKARVSYGRRKRRGPLIGCEQAPEPAETANPDPAGASSSPWPPRRTRDRSSESAENNDP